MNAFNLVSQAYQPTPNPRTSDARPCSETRQTRTVRPSGILMPDTARTVSFPRPTGALTEPGREGWFVVSNEGRGDEKRLRSGVPPTLSRAESVPRSDSNDVAAVPEKNRNTARVGRPLVP